MPSKVGVGHWTSAATGSDSERRLRSEGVAAFFAALTVIVGQFGHLSARLLSPTPRFGFSNVTERSTAPERTSLTVAVGQDKEPLANMACTHGLCAEYIPAEIEPAADQVSSDDWKAVLAEAGDVLEEAPIDATVINDAEHVGPQPSLILKPLLLPGLGKWGARNSANDAANQSAPSSAVEGSNVSPYKSLG